MGLFGIGEKRKAAESEITQKLRAHPLLELLVKNVLNEANTNEKWISACQSYYDNCKRKVTIEPDGFEIKWYTSREEPYTGSDGSVPNSV